MAFSSLSAPLLPNGLNLSKRSTRFYHELVSQKAPNVKLRHLYSGTGMTSDSLEKVAAESSLIGRRTILGLISAASAFKLAAAEAIAAGLPEEQKPRLCDEACEKELENISVVTTESGLQYKDIQVGTGPSPPVGFQVAANYVAMVPNGQIFDSSLEKGQPYIFRVGSGQVIKGLDEGLLSMKIGGKRRLFIPGPSSIFSSIAGDRQSFASKSFFSLFYLHLRRPITPGMTKNSCKQNNPARRIRCFVDGELEEKKRLPSYRIGKKSLRRLSSRKKRNGPATDRKYTAGPSLNGN